MAVHWNHFGSFKTGKERADANPLSPTLAMPSHQLFKSLNAQPWLATPDGATHHEVVKHLILQVRKWASFQRGESSLHEEFTYIARQGKAGGRA